MLRSSFWQVFAGVLLFSSSLFSEGEDSTAQDLVNLENMLNQQVHSASKYWQYLNEIPSSVSIVSSRDIEMWGCSTLTEVLSRVRSFYTTYDGNYTYLGVRGFSRPGDYNNRILVTINGHSINENIYDGAYIGTEFGYGPEMIDRIEVVRGPGSSVYGASAVFAVINVITKNAAENEGLRLFSSIMNGKGLRYGFNYGHEFSNGLETFLSLSRYTNPGNDYYFPEFDTDSTNFGKTSGTDKEKSDGLFGQIKFGSFTFQAGGVTRKKNIPTASYVTIFNDPDLWTIDNRAFAELSYTNPVSESVTLSSRLGYDVYYFEGSYPFHEAGKRTINDEKSLGQWFLADNQIKWDIAESNNLLLGIELQRHANAIYQYGYGKNISFRVNAPAYLTSFYVQDDHRASEKLLISLGGRVDKYTNRDVEFSPRIGLVYTYSQQQTIKFLFGKTFRKPNLYETYYEDPSTNFMRSHNLSAERIRSYELMYQNRMSRDAILSFSLYHNQMRYLIDVEEDPNTGEAMYVNAQNINSYGIEMVFDARVAQSVRCFVTVGLYNTKQEGSNDPLTNSPGALFKGNITYSFSRSSNITFNGIFEPAKRMWNGFNTESALVHDIGYITRLFNDNFEVSLFVKNLFNVSVYHPTGTELTMPSLKQQGRTLFIKGAYALH